MTLDLAVSRAVAQNRLLERALHSRQAWFIGIGDVHVRAERRVHERGVSFTACFSDVPPTADATTLSEGPEVHSSRPFEYPGVGEFCLTWDLSLEESLTV